MDTPIDRLRYLLNQYANQLSDQSEENELFELLNTVSQTEIEPMLIDILERTEPRPDEFRRQRILEKIDIALNRDIALVSPETAKLQRMIYWKRVAVAASVILVIGMGSYFLFFNHLQQDQIAKTNIPQDVKAPTTNRAMITLSNGKKIILDSAGNGTLAKQGNVSVIKTDDGKIAYQSTDHSPHSIVEYNTLFNPRGSKVVNLTLSDGTRVWLNSESSLKYPVAFNGNERKVEITGEAYFEVAHDARKKFIVDANGVNTEVLGTHFNVNAYNDEASTKVTLMEGSVKVSKGSSINFLKPGQQADVSSEVKVINGVDVDEVMAWKEGYFHFENSDLKTILGQFARWYDIEIVYEGSVTNRKFFGIVKRSNTLTKVLEMLRDNNIDFKIEGKRLIVKSE